jgi:transcriptional regulator with XRE-family HTH domain
VGSQPARDADLLNRLTLAGYQPGLGENLASARLRAGMTQFELAEAAGVKSHAMISRYERGARTPAQATLKRLAEAVGVSPRKLKGGTL